MPQFQRCRDCQCTNDRACSGGCYWIKPGLCSVCYEAALMKLADEANEWRDSLGEIVVDSIALLGGFRFKIEVGRGPTITVTDHIGLVVFSMDPDGVFLAPHYDPRELVALFASEQARAA